MAIIGHVISLVLSYIKLQVARYAYLIQLVLYQLHVVAHCIWSHANLVKKTLAGRLNRAPSLQLAHGVLPVNAFINMTGITNHSLVAIIKFQNFGTS